MHFKGQGQAGVLFCVLFRTTEPGPPFQGSFTVINHKMPSDSLQYQAVTFKVLIKWDVANNNQKLY